MTDCNTIDALMIDRLYDELDETRAAWFDEHLESCARCAAELSSLSRTRAAVSQLPQLEPPSSVSAILLHEAAKRAPAAPRPSSEHDSPTLFGRITAWLFPVLRHPAAAAVAVLVLVAGVAGALYVRGEHRVARPEVASSKSEADTTAAPAASDPGTVDGVDPAELQRRIASGKDVIDEDHAVRLQTGDPSKRDKAASAPRKDEVIDVRTVQPKLKQPRPASKGRRGKRVKLDNDRAELAKIRVAREKKKFALEPNQENKRVSKSATNAITGADVLVADDVPKLSSSYRAKGRAARVPGLTKPGKSNLGPGSKAAESVPPSRGSVIKDSKDSTRSYTMKGDAKTEVEWAQAKEQLLLVSVKKKQCLAAARIANDIRDRNPGFFQRNVEGAKYLRPCAVQVSRERSRRIHARAARAKPRPARSGASAPKSKHAAPRKAMQPRSEAFK